jgi:hypothetical protein
MNRHAEKLVDPIRNEPIDAVLGGVLEEHHCCPACGHAESRRLAP